MSELATIAVSGMEVVSTRSNTATGTDQVVVRFPNGYGASVVRGPYTYGGDSGLFELAVLQFTGHGDDFDLTYDTEITDDVVGWLNVSDVEALLHRVAQLQTAVAP